MAKTPVEEFQHTLSVHRIADRFATDFSSPEALREYLRDHPNADPKKHHVVKPDEASGTEHRSPGGLKVKVKPPKELAKDFDDVWGKRQPPDIISRIRRHIDRDEDVPIAILERANTVLKTEAIGASKEQAAKLKALARKLKDHSKIRD